MDSLCFLLVISLAASASASLQTYEVKGELICPMDPSKVSNIQVKMLDKNRLLPDTKMADVKTDEFGKFYVKGKANSISKIDPELHIYHHCLDHTILPHILKCKLKHVVILPKDYIDLGTPFDAGRINLEAKQVNEKRDCIH